MSTGTNEIKITESMQKRPRLSDESSIDKPQAEVEEVLSNNTRRDESTPRSSSSSRINSLRSKLTELSSEYPELNDIKEFPMIIQTLKIKELRCENEEKCPLYKLPQDLFNKCLSFLDKSYGFVAPVSKHLYDSYVMTFDGSTETRADFRGLSKEAGVYLMESFPHEFSSEEHKWDIGWYIYETDASFKSFAGLTFTYTDYLMHKAARQGNLDVYKHYLENGYDILRAQGKHWTLFRNLGEYGHLHILQYLREHQSYFRGFCYSAIGASRGGHVKIIDWIQNEIGCFSNDTKDVSILVDECVMEATEHGRIEVLKWLYKNIDYIGFSPDRVIGNANLDTIKFYIEKDPSTNYFAEKFEDTIIETDSIDVIKFFEKNGFQFTATSTKTAAECGYFDILKYLISIGVEIRFDDIKDYYMDSFEMVKLRFEKEKVWWNNASIINCMRRESGGFNVEMLRYLHGHACPLVSTPNLTVDTFLETAMSFVDMDILEYIVHKMSHIPDLKDNILNIALDYGWEEGFKYIIQSLDGCSLPSLNQVLRERPDLDFIKYCEIQGMKWDSVALRADTYNDLRQIAIVKDWDLLKWRITKELASNTLQNFPIFKIAKFFDFRRDVLQYLCNSGFSTKNALMTAIENIEVKAVKSLVEIGFKVDEDIFACALRNFDNEPTDKDLEILSLLLRKGCPQKKEWFK